MVFTNPTAGTSVNNCHMVKKGRRTSKRKASVKNEESKNGKIRCLHIAKKAEAESSSGEYFQSEGDEIGKKIGVREQTSPFNGSKTHATLGGPKNSLHGIIYQLKLLMLFLWRGVQLDIEFRLATEMAKAKKFNDVVFQYKVKTESKICYRFLQAKHRQDETKKITAHDLLTEADDDFSLQKYFVSYCKISRDPDLNRNRLKDFIICTNIDFDYEGLKAAGIRTKRVVKTDDLLDFKSTEKRAKRYKFCKIPSKLHEVLKQTADVHRLAKIIVDHVFGGKKIILNNPLLKDYHAALAKEIIDLKKKAFFDDFVKGQNLSERGNNFRKIFLDEASKRFTKLLKKDSSEDAIWKEITKNRLDVSSNFGQANELSTEPTLNPLPEFSDELVKLIQSADDDYLVKVDGTKYRKNAKLGSRRRVFADNINQLAGHVLIMKDEIIKFHSAFFRNTKLPGNLEDLRNSLKNKLGITYDDLDKYQFKMPEYFKIIDEELLYPKIELPGDVVDDKDIEIFFAKLIFAVNQPNEIELGELITREIGADSKFNLLNADLVGDSFEKKMLDWLKKKGREKGREGSFFSYTDAKDFFNTVEQKVDNLVTVGLSLPYQEELKGYGMKFKNVNDVLKNFLTSDSGHGAKSALNLIAAQETLLTAIKVQQAIQQLDGYKRYDSLIFLRLRTLRSRKIEELVTRAFKSVDSYHLLVINCQLATKQDLEVLCRLNQTMEEMMNETMKKNNKKLILITRDNEPPSNRPDVFPENCCEAHDNFSFKDLTTDSQLKLISAEVIRFQGDQQRRSFEKLLDIVDFDDIVMQDLEDAIDTETLMKLIRNEEIEIGSDLQGLEEVDKYYIPRTIVQEVIIKDNIFESQLEFDEFAISTGEKDAPKFRGLVLERGKEAEEFEKLCKASGKNVHWLKYVSGKFVWHRSRGDITFLMKHRDVSESLSSNDLISSTEYDLVDLDDGRKVVIISDSGGTGKTTMLTHLAKEIKKKNPGHWVIMINLNDFTKALDQELHDEQLERQNPDASDTDKAVEFLVEKLSKLDTELDKKILKTMIKNRSKVVLLFDGFDEISPKYTNIVIYLLQELKKIGKGKLFVATRPHMRELLEDELRIFSFTMELLSDENQIDFLIGFWKAELGLGDVEQRIDQRLKTYAETLINKVIESIDETAKDVLRVPVQLRMIAKLFQDGEGGRVSVQRSETCKEFLDSENAQPNFKAKLNIVDLYRSLVDDKFNIYNTDKKNANSTNLGVQDDSQFLRKTFLKRHQKLAMHTLFNVETFDNSSGMPTHSYLLKRRERKDIHADINKIIKGRERIGIITQVVNGRSQFIHRTFAEYFAATFIFDTLLKRADRNPDVRKFLVQEILLESQHKVIRAFLNGLLPDIFQQPDDAALKKAWEIDIDKYSYQRDSIFHTASREGQYKIIKFFLNRINQHGTRKDLISIRVGNDDRTVLRIAADDHQWDELMWLIENGAADVRCSIGNGRTPLHAAVSQGNLHIAKWLVNGGASVDAADDNGQTPLHIAAQSGKLDVSKWLVDEEYVDVNSRCKKGVTPLHLAVTSGNIPLLEWLIKEKGANVRARTDEGETVLLYAVCYEQWDVARLLTDSCDADVEVESGSSNTEPFLFYAVDWNRADMIKWLVNDKSIRVGSTFADGSSILHRAIAAGSINVVKWLICENNADPNEIDNNGCTPLSQALKAEEIEIFEWLVNHGNADVNASDAHGMTALHVAADLRSHLIEALVETYGADINALNDVGKRPVDLYGNGPDLKFLQTDTWIKY